MRLTSYLAATTAVPGEVPKKTKRYQFRELLPVVGWVFRASNTDKVFHVEKPIDVLYHVVYFPQSGATTYFLADYLKNLIL